MPHLVHSFAGPLAEANVNHRVHEFNSHHDDVEGAKQLAAYSICEIVETEDGMQITMAELKSNEARLSELLDLATKAATKLVCDHWASIAKVADLLIERKQLSGDEVAAIVNAA